MGKKNRNRVVAFFLMVILCCSNLVIANPQRVYAETQKNLDMCVGDSMSIWLEGSGETAYQSSDKKIVSVTTEGKISALKPGSCDITMTKNGYSFVYHITVTLTGSAKNDKKLKSIAKKLVKKNMTDDEKVKAVHDYMVLNCAYDQENYLNGTVPQESYAVKGFLENHTAVCEGYAKTFYAFMQIMGIPCRKVSGTGNGGAHAWNLVKLNGKWFHIDVTWDDPVPDRPGQVRYEYFLLSDKQMSAKAHVWSGEGLPKCKTSGDRYVSLLGTVCKSKSDVEKQFQKQTSKNVSTYFFIFKNGSGLDEKSVYEFAWAAGINNLYYSKAAYGEKYTLYYFFEK